ncbi:4Fe-4S dicluster domain-containing protein [Sinorhizobium medicae]|uniref:4Fe-4S dicluster domain-containing protein n=1 Tax=Sinorhizobium medicae TaxID=110321 RepID=UPI0003F99AB6|nr:ferredoxin family protein [Sinorhizobium medicae]MDX0952771.1 4Fe-4S dicluster domain-containing protein [Sinorhizobium medicae]MDX1010147.1 4Fe-4S dicluster domain-containing protein [Sinorhizobium medicae]MDX1053811.1 4Fe-4S dicluster domain-containing protein [Sinorhizobium medicae]MDX1066172.1 4Fe-4S dicluster domain-containing protein [Sinorhizobium medicae]MDX1084396.1 4Fe-4S dicluster domain-containing protein [Sinorhizobium medicae]
MIEIVSADRCIRCDICERICPAFVFDRDEQGLPVIARQDDCQTCFLCEIYCPTNALYVAEQAHEPIGITEAEVLERDLFGVYARALGWNRGRAGGTQNDPTRHIRVAQV